MSTSPTPGIADSCCASGLGDAGAAGTAGHRGEGLGRPLKYVIFSLMALTRDPLY